MLSLSAGRLTAMQGCTCSKSFHATPAASLRAAACLVQHPVLPQHRRSAHQQHGRPRAAAPTAEADSETLPPPLPRQHQSALPKLRSRERYQPELSRTEKNAWRKASQQLGKDIVVVTIGRAGITRNTLISLGDALSGSELVKVSATRAYLRTLALIVVLSRPFIYGQAHGLTCAWAAAATWTCIRWRRH